MRTIPYSGEYPTIQQVGNYDNIPGGGVYLLNNWHTYELITDRLGEHVQIERCEREQV